MTRSRCIRDACVTLACLALFYGAAIAAFYVGTN